MSQPTAEQLTDAIARALHDGNVDAVEGLLRMLAVVDPHRAQDVYDTIQAGLAIAGRTGT